MRDLGARHRITVPSPKREPGGRYTHSQVVRPGDEGSYPLSARPVRGVTIARVSAAQRGCGKEMTQHLRTMRHRAGFELIVTAALTFCLAFSATAWSAEPPSPILEEILAALEKNPDLKAWHDIHISRGTVRKLDSSAFRLESSGSFPDRHAHRFIMAAGKGFPDSASPAVVTSPDKTRALLWSPMSGEIDSDAYLANLETREAVRVIQCGSPCIVELGAWLAPRRFVITAVWENLEEAGHHLRFIHFDLDTDIVTHFRGPTLKPGVGQEVSRAWCRWLIQRFPQGRRHFLGCP